MTPTQCCVKCGGGADGGAYVAVAPMAAREAAKPAKELMLQLSPGAAAMLGHPAPSHHAFAVATVKRAVMAGEADALADTAATAARAGRGWAHR